MAENGLLKDKSGVGIIVDLFKRLHCCEWCEVLFSIVFSFNLRNYIFQSVKKCKMTSSSLHVDLKEAAKCVDIILD